MSAHPRIQKPEDDGGPWTPAEIAWAQDCFRAGDELAEIAATAERDFLDVAMAVEAYGYVSRERRWRPSTPGAPRRFVGGLLKEVAVYRYARGEAPDYLARLAGVSPSTMWAVLKGVRRQPPTDAPLIAAARRALAFVIADREEHLASACVLDPNTHSPKLETLGPDTAAFLATRHDPLIADLQAALASRGAGHG